jgi:hypothetical protein
MLRPALAAQQAGEAVAAWRDQFRLTGQDDLPHSRRSFDCQRIGAAEQRDVRHAFQRPGQEIDDQSVAEIET